MNKLTDRYKILQHIIEYEGWCISFRHNGYELPCEMCLLGWDGYECHSTPEERVNMSNKILLNKKMNIL